MLTFRTFFLAWAGSALLVAGAPAQNGLYWVEFEPGHVRRSSLAGSGVQTTVPGTFADTFPAAIDLHPADGHQYWAQGGLAGNPSIIRRSGLNGAGATDILNLGLDNTAIGLAVDALNNHIYWTDASPFGNTVRRSNLDGTGVTTLVGGLTDPQHIDVDPSGGKMYWVADNRVFRADLSGANQQLLYTAVGNQQLSGISVDGVNGRLYFTDWFNGNIHRSALDGTGLQTILTTSGAFPRSIDVDPLFGIAVANSDGATFGWIGTAALDGSGFQVVVPSLNTPWDVVILVPAPGGLAALGLAGVLALRAPRRRT